MREPYGSRMNLDCFYLWDALKYPSMHPTQKNPI